MAATGFDIHFIDNHTVSFPQLSAEQQRDLVVRDRRRTGELKYLHFSVFLSKSRRFPFFTATNIDGGLFKRIPRKKIFDSGNDEWSIDDRVPDDQWGQVLYNAKKSDFQRGHMTKREDPQWGETVEEAREAAQQTFHFTNCVPQLGELNTEDWGKLETYILSQQSVPNQLKINVFTGPVLSPADPVFVTAVRDEEVQLPTLFWKVVYYTNDGETLNRVAFLMGQENLLLQRRIAVRTVTAFDTFTLAPEFFQDFEDKEIYQVNVSTVEKLTGLRFAEAQEPYRDKRPLKLIIDKVQVANVENMSVIESMNVDDSTNEAVNFPNIVLTSVEAGNQPMGVDAMLAPASEVTTFSAAARSGPQEQYTRDIKNNFGYYATWNPGTPLKLGDIGILKGDVFRKIGDLSQRGITFNIQHDTTPTDLKYSSRGSVSMAAKLAGAATIPGSSLAQGDAGIVVEFTKENAVLFQANGTLTDQIDDTITLGEKILDLYKQGKWDKNWAVITELITSSSATILISNAKGAKIELKANANVNAPSIDIADAQFAFSAQFSRSLETQIVAKEGLTPLFRVRGIKTSWFTSPEFSSMGITGLDLLTPKRASDPQIKGNIFFGYLSDSPFE